MSERTDHAAEAKRLVGATETRDWNEESPYVDRRIAAAQVHATLALVRQQQIANLIALASQDTYLGPNPAGSARRTLVEMVRDPEDGEYMHRFRPDIAAALGIEVQS